MKNIILFVIATIPVFAEIKKETIKGGIPPEVIDQTIRKHMPQFQSCYELRSDPALGGEVGTRFEVGAEGIVTKAKVESSTLKSDVVEKCAVELLKRIKFPKPIGGGIVNVSYPLSFSPN